MVKVVDNEIVETFYTLVNPHDYFSETNIHVHGIHPEDVKGAPDFKRSLSIYVAIYKSITRSGT